MIDAIFTTDGEGETDTEDNNINNLVDIDKDRYIETTQYKQ